MDRANQRKAYRAREWDTQARDRRAGDPNLGEGSYFPDWLLGVLYQPGTEAGRDLGVALLSKPQVSVMAFDLNERGRGDPQSARPTPGP